ncbi:bile acid:sodium symporter [Candidatus Uhrbacteria bacterium]|nr:bile acid:sodium symporter [Candidatus Uhrbacteria bacterium]
MAFLKRIGAVIFSYASLMILAVGAGLLFPAWTGILSSQSSLFLQGIFFLAGLSLHPKDSKHALAQPVRFLCANVVMLIVFPVCAYWIARVISPSSATAIMLLGAMPTAMSAPFFTALANGSLEIALALTVSTSVLAPFTIPLVAAITVGQTVAIDFVSMIQNLVLIMILPLALAQVLRVCVGGRTVDRILPLAKPTSTTLLALLIAGVVAQYAEQIRANIHLSLLGHIGILLLFGVLAHAAGYAVGIGRPRAERIAYTASLAYMNVVLAVYVASRYFPEYPTPLLTVVAFIIWTFAFVFFKTAVEKHFDEKIGRVLIMH